MAGGLGLLHLETHHEALRADNVLLLLSPTQAPWKRLLRETIELTTNGWIVDEFLFFSTFPLGQLKFLNRTNRMLEPYWIDICTTWRRHLAFNIARNQQLCSLEEFMAQPLFYNKEITFVRVNNNTPTQTPRPLDDKTLIARILKSRNIRRVGGMMEWNTVEKSFTLKSFQDVQKIPTTESTNDNLCYAQREYRRLCLALRESRPEDHLRPKPLKLGEFVATKVSEDGGALEVARVETVKYAMQEARPCTTLTMQPFTMYESGYIQHDDAPLMVAKINDGSRPPDRVIVKCLDKRKPLGKHHKGNHVAGLSRICPVHTAKRQFEIPGYKLATDGTLIVTTTIVPLDKTKHLYEILRPKPEKTLEKLENVWRELCKRPVHLGSVFNLTLPKARLDRFGKALQWLIAHQAIATNERRMHRHCSDGKCVYEDCGARETLTHIFLKCRYAENLWKWAARVLRRAFDLNICMPRCESPASPPRTGILYFDGACRQKGRSGRGPGGWGAMLFVNGTRTWAGSGHLSDCTVNEAEWTALDAGAAAADCAQVEKLETNGDSKLVQKAMVGEITLRDKRMKKLRTSAMAKLSEIPRYDCHWVPRKLNKDADRLANYGADGHAVDLWLVPPPPPHSQRTRKKCRRPDVATALLGILPNQVRTINNGRNDWLHIVRFIVLTTISNARKAKWSTGAAYSFPQLKKKASRLIRRELLFRAAAKVSPPKCFLRTPSRKKALSKLGPEDFVEIDQW